MTRLTLLMALCLTFATPAGASAIQKACLKSPRGAGQHSLCTCIQQAANATLTKRDQSLAATFFSDPHRAQEIRQSGTRQNSAFWERYKKFGDLAGRACR